jgi:hypothetical protein
MAMATAVQAENHKKLSGEIDLIVDQVKKAILEVDKDAPSEGPALTIKEADLTLSLVRTKKGGVDAGFKLFGHDLGFTADRTKADTHTIDIKLKPSADVMELGHVDVQQTLVDAMRAIRDSVAKAAQSEPRFALDEASVELNFQVDDNGTISFVFVGEGKWSNAQTVKLTLGSS